MKRILLGLLVSIGLAWGAVAQTLPSGDGGSPASNVTLQKAWRPSVNTLTVAAATTTPNFDNFQDFVVTLVHATCACTFANPSTTLVPGQAGTITFIQSATGSDTVAWGANFKFAGGTAPTLSTAANAVDVFSYKVITASKIVVSSGVLNAN